MLTALLFLSTSWGGISLAGEPPPTPPPAAEGEAPPEESLQEKVVSFGRSMEATHDQLERDIMEQVIRLDNFFGNVKTEERRKTRYELRWRNSLRVGENGNMKPGTTLRANVVLSRISDRLRLAISGEDTTEQISPSIPEDPGNPGFDRTSQNARIVNTELRYTLVKESDLDLFLGAGFRVVIPPEGFVRSRFQFSHAISDLALFRFGETLFIKNTSGLGETTEIDLERLVDKHTLMRWANAGTVSEEFNGMEWGSEVSMLRELTPRSAITVTTGIYGNTNASTMVGNYKISARYRRNFLRNWLFYEVEPEVSWPRNVAGQYLATFAFTGRIEVVFQGSAEGNAKTGGPH